MAEQISGSFTIPSTGAYESVGYQPRKAGGWIVETGYADRADADGADPVIVRATFGQFDAAKAAAKDLKERLLVLPKADGFPIRHSAYTDAHWARVDRIAGIIAGWLKDQAAAGAVTETETFND